MELLCSLKSTRDVNLLSKLSIVTLHSLKIMELRPIVFKEWRDTRTFSDLKSTHCTLLILSIINPVAKQSLCIVENLNYDFIIRIKPVTYNLKINLISCQPGSI
jgi:hypothetical protein